MSIKATVKGTLPYKEWKEDFRPKLPPEVRNADPAAKKQYSFTQSLLRDELESQSFNHASQLHSFQEASRRYGRRRSISADGRMPAVIVPTKVKAQDKSLLSRMGSFLFGGYSDNSKKVDCVDGIPDVTCSSSASGKANMETRNKSNSTFNKMARLIVTPIPLPQPYSPAKTLDAEDEYFDADKSGFCSTPPVVDVVPQFLTKNNEHQLDFYDQDNDNDLSTSKLSELSAVKAPKAIKKYGIPYRDLQTITPSNW